MKKVLLIASLLAAVMVIGVTQATAQQTADVTVTVTIPSVISVSLDPDAWAIGDVGLGWTKTLGADYFTATNDGNVTEDFSIVSGDSTNWTCGTAAGSEVFFMEAQGGDLTAWTSIDESQALETSVAKTTGTVSFTLQFTAPTATTYLDTQQSITVTVTAEATT